MKEVHTAQQTRRRKYLTSLAAAGALALSGCAGVLDDDDTEPIVEEQDDQTEDDDQQDEESEDDATEDEDERVYPQLETFGSTDYHEAEIPVVTDRMGVRNESDERLAMVLMSGLTSTTRISPPLYDIPPGGEASFVISEDNTEENKSDVSVESGPPSSIELAIFESDLPQQRELANDQEPELIAEHMEGSTWRVSNPTDIEDPREINSNSEVITDYRVGNAFSDDGNWHLGKRHVDSVSADEIIFEHGSQYWRSVFDITFVSATEEEQFQIGFPGPPTDLEIAATPNTSDTGDRISIESIDVDIIDEPELPVPYCLAAVTESDEVVQNSGYTPDEFLLAGPSFTDTEDYNVEEGDTGLFWGMSNIVALDHVVPLEDSGGGRPSEQTVDTIGDFTIPVNTSLELPINEDEELTVTLHSWDSVLAVDQIPVTDLF